MAKPVSCERCRGAMWIGVDVPWDHPLFGKTKPCPACNGVAKIVARNLERLSVIPGELADTDSPASWLTFPAGVDRKALVAMQAYVEEVREEMIGDKGKRPRGMILSGVNQIGKTGLAYCAHIALAQARDRRWKILPTAPTVASAFITTSALIDRFRVAKMDDEHLNAYARLINDFASVTHLVIDDLGAQRVNDSRLEALFELLDRRMTTPHTATTITTNLTQDELQDLLGDRIYYRFKGRLRWQPVQGSAGVLVKGA